MHTSLLAPHEPCVNRSCHSDSNTSGRKGAAPVQILDVPVGRRPSVWWAQPGWWRQIGCTWPPVLVKSPVLTAVMMLQTWGNEARLIFLAFVNDLMLTSAWFPTPHESYACFLWLFVFKQAFRSMSLSCDSLSWNKSRAIRECTTCIQFYRITIFLADHPSQHLTPTPVFPKQETTRDKRQFFLEGLKDLQQMIPTSVICHIFFGSFKDVLFF